MITRPRIVRVLALGFVLVTLNGCVELTAGLFVGVMSEVANVAVSSLPQPIAKGSAMCALPETQDVRVCTDALVADGWQAVEFRDGEWRPITDAPGAPPGK